jgi:predicted nucleic acid-binding Zn ribbon protein
MTDGSSSSVECPVCGETFDPTAAGGWCTNSACGQWRYEGEPSDATEAAGEADIESALEEMESQSDGIEESSDDKDESSQAATGATGQSETERDETETAATAFDCPGCGTELDAGAEFCPSCGEDLSDYDTESAETSDAVDTSETANSSEATESPDTIDVPVSDDQSEEPDASEDDLEACPSCGRDVDSDASFCVDCGEALDTHRGGLAECPSCGRDVDPGASFCADCGEALDADRTGAGGTADAEPNAGSYDSLVLEAEGSEIVVSDGDAIGRELRRILTEAGGDEDDALRIHREHIRFAREDGQFFLVDLGRNPTRLNNIDMTQGDRKPVGPGDEIDLSGVISIEVHEP